LAASPKRQFALLPSVGTWLAKVPKPMPAPSASVPKQAGASSASHPSVIPFKEYYNANFQSLSADDLASLHSKFPQKPKPATSGLAASGKKPFALLPSVGTWLAKVPKPMYPSLQAGQARSIETNLQDAQIKVVSPIAVMRFDDIDVNHDGKIDKDEWERAFVKANDKGGWADRVEDDHAVVAKLQQTLSEKDKELAALRALLRSSGHGDELRNLSN